jgi:hypothetical protein
MKPFWQNVQQEAPDELVGAECHGGVSRLPVAAVILVAEGHTALVESNEPAVCDGDAMSVPGEIRCRFFLSPPDVPTDSQHDTPARSSRKPNNPVCAVV